MLDKFLAGSGVVFIIILVLVFRPVPIVTEDKALTETGVVSHIFEAGVKDVCFRLRDNERTFYINRGLENGLELEQLRDRLTGEPVTIKYPRYWTPLDWNNRVKHISKLEYKDEVLFNEFRDN